MNGPLGLIGVPSSLGGPGRGTEEGPRWLRSAGLVARLRETGIEVHDLGDVPLPEAGLTAWPELAGIDALALLVRARASTAIQEGMLPVILGGDHTVALGAIAASAAAYPNLGILWVDAHPDFNTPGTSKSGHPHGMVLALAAGLGPTGSLARLGRTPLVLPQRICVLGARSIDESERALLATSGVRLATTSEVIRDGPWEAVAEAARYLAGHGADALHLSIDLDVLDPSEYPGVSTPAPHGFNLDDLRSVMEAACTEMNVVSLDLVELTPTHDHGERTTRAGVAVLEAVAAALLDAPFREP